MIIKIKKVCFLIGFFFIIGHIARAQDQRFADSLVDIYLSDSLIGKAKMELLRKLSFNEVNDYSKRLNDTGIHCYYIG